MDGEYVREPVRTFSYLMEKELRKNDWKGGWDHNSVEALFIRLVEEVGEIAKAIDRGKGIVTECVDVANFCMMIADTELTRKIMEKTYGKRDR